MTSAQLSSIAQQTAQKTAQQRHLAALIERYSQRTVASKCYAQTYRPVLADKSSLGLGFSPALKELCYPIVAQRSEGAKLWDIDGNEYTDILMGLGINLFGHNPPFLREAIAAQLETGIQIAAQSELAGEVAQLICELTGAERVTFSNTGTEAIMTAIRIARAATNRPRIAVFTNSYHGHSDQTLVRATLGEYAKKAVGRAIERRQGWLASLLQPLQTQLQSSLNPKAVPAAPGIPAEVAKNVLVLDYGNPRSLEVIKAHRRELAAVLVEPVQSRRPELQPQAFLQELRAVTAANQIALIFDEMVTGFRIHPGGAQAWFDVTADIVTYSKIIGGVIAGKAAYLDRIDGGLWQFGDASEPQVKQTFFAGTFCKHPLALAAAKAVLLKLKSHPPQELLNQRTAALVERLSSSFSTQNIPIRFTQFGSFFAVDRAQTAVPQMGLDLLSYHLLLRGIHLRQGDQGGFLSTAHTEADIEKIFQVFQDSADELNRGGYL
jgi:glutamate-1-semialdehyde 2,1-aminomutase